jgi:hypothetical protein
MKKEHTTPKTTDKQNPNGKRPENDPPSLFLQSGLAPKAPVTGDDEKTANPQKEKDARPVDQSGFVGPVSIPGWIDSWSIMIESVGMFSICLTT